MHSHPEPPGHLHEPGLPREGVAGGEGQRMADPCQGLLTGCCRRRATEESQLLGKGSTLTWALGSLQGLGLSLR